MSETSLIVQLNRGENEAWQKIHDMFYYQLLNYINGITHNREYAKELAQDCFVKIYESKPQFEAIQQLKAFLFRSAKNAALNYLRSTARKMDNSIELTAVHDTDENLEDVSAREYEHSDLINDIIQEIRNQPPQRRRAFELTYLDEKLQKEVARIMGIHVSRVYEYNTTTLKRLRKKFGPVIEKFIKVLFIITSLVKFFA